MGSTGSQFPGLSYSADSTHLAIVDRVDGAGPHAIFILSTQTGERTQLTNPGDATTGDTHPVYSPDGSQVAFVRDGDVYVVSAEGGEPDRLSVDADGIAGMSWSADGHHVVYAAGERLWSVCASGGEPTPVDAIGAGAITPTMGPANQLVFASGGNLSLARTITP